MTPRKAKKVKLVIKVFRQCNKNAVETARQLKEHYQIYITPVTVRNYAIRTGEKTGKHGGARKPVRQDDGRISNLSQQEKEELWKLYDVYHGNSSVVAKETSYSRAYIRKIWSFHDPPLTPQGRSNRRAYRF